MFTNDQQLHTWLCLEGPLSTCLEPKQGFSHRNVPPTSSQLSRPIHKGKLNPAPPSWSSHLALLKCGFLESIKWEQSLSWRLGVEFIPYITLSTIWLIVFASFFTVSLMLQNISSMRTGTLFCSLLFSQCQEQRLTRGRYSIKYVLHKEVLSFHYLPKMSIFHGLGLHSTGRDRDEETILCLHGALFRLQ